MSKHAWFALLTMALFAPSASAQSASPSVDPTFAAMLLAGSTAAQPFTSAALTVSALGSGARAPAREIERKLRRSRWRMAIGAGMLTGAVLGAVVVASNRYCEYYERNVDQPVSFAAAGVLGGIGLTLTIAGGATYKHTAAKLGGLARATPGQRAGMVFTSLAVAATTFGVVGALSIPAHVLECGST